MTERAKILITGTLTMVSVALSIVVVSLCLMYNTSLQQNKIFLKTTTTMYAAMIKQIELHEIEGQAEHREQEILLQIKHILQAHKMSNGAGELVFAKRVGDEIVFLLENNKGQIPPAIPWGSDLSNAMHQALSGLEGTSDGIDYRGNWVLASYIPIKSSSYGLVVKIDISKIKAPLIHTATIVSLVSMFLIACGVVVIMKFTSPLLFRLENAEFKQRLLNEALFTSNQDLEQFAYIASHDLREPLRMVSNYCRLLQRRCQDKLDDKANKFINYAVDGTTRMNILITDLLEFSRVTSQGVPLVPVVLRDVLQEVLHDINIAITESHCRIKFDLNHTVSADHTQIYRVFQNLISNAIKFKSETEGVNPELRIQSQPDQDNMCLISVQDNGIGINPAYHDKIFVIFQCLHGQKYEGTGIGLAVCKKIIERHAGQIWVESVLGQGATFYFTLKLVK